MAGGTRYFGGKRMRLVAVETTQAFVDAGRGAVVAAAELAESVGGMALHAKPLAGVGRHLDGTIALPDGRGGQEAGGKMRLFVAYVKLRGTALGGRSVDLMAGQARNGRLCLLRFVFQRPRPMHIERTHQFVDVARVEHAVAAQTIGGKLLGLVMIGIEEDVGHRSLRGGWPASRQKYGRGTPGRHHSRQECPVSVSRIGLSALPEKCCTTRLTGREGMDIERQRSAMAVAAMHGGMANWTTPSGRWSFRGKMVQVLRGSP